MREQDERVKIELAIQREREKAKKEKIEIAKSLKLPHVDFLILLFIVKWLEHLTAMVKFKTIFSFFQRYNTK